MQNTFSRAYRLIHQNFAHCIGQCKWQLVRLRISQADCQAPLRVPVDQQDFLPACASPIPKLAQVVVLPTPPFWLAMAMICVFINFTSFLIVAVASGNRKSRHSKIKSEVSALSIAGIQVSEMKKAPSYLSLSACIRIVFNCSDLVRLCQTLQWKIQCLRVPNHPQKYPPESLSGCPIFNH